MMKTKSNLLLLFVVGVALLAVFMVRQSRRETAVPEELVGVWTTSEPRYSDRFFELKKTQIVLGIGGSETVTGPIRSIDGVRDNESILYTITYRVFNEDPEGEDFLFSFYYYPQQKMIQFKNQKNFQWVRDEDPS